MADPALAAVADLEKRLGVPVGSLTGVDLARAQSDLEDASGLVRAETGKTWLDSEGQPNAPQVVVTIVLRAAQRCYRNPSGFSSETEDGYTWRLREQDVSPYLTDDEIRLLARYASTSDLHVQRFTRHGPDEPYCLRDQYGGDPILVHDSTWPGPW